MTPYKTPADRLEEALEETLNYIEDEYVISYPASRNGLRIHCWCLEI